MAAVSREEFFASPDAKAAMDAYAEACLDLVEEGKESTEFPDPEKYLEGQGLELPEGSWKVQHRVQALGAEPEQIVCPDGSWGCTYVCNDIGGKQHCAYVCHC